MEAFARDDLTAWGEQAELALKSCGNYKSVFALTFLFSTRGCHTQKQSCHY